MQPDSLTMQVSLCDAA